MAAEARLAVEVEAVVGFIDGFGKVVVERGLRTGRVVEGFAVRVCVGG